jgi:hypothetical protein
VYESVQGQGARGARGRGERRGRPGLGARAARGRRAGRGGAAPARLPSAGAAGPGFTASRAMQAKAFSFAAPHPACPLLPAVRGGMSELLALRETDGDRDVGERLSHAVGAWWAAWQREDAAAAGGER